MGRSSGRIRRIAKLSELVKRWRGRSSPHAPSDVPPGHVAVIVGSERRRFVVRASHLNHPAFQRLLGEAAEKYGFGYPDGPIAIPSDESLFLEALRLSSSARSSSLNPVRFTRLGKCKPDLLPAESSQPLLFGLTQLSVS